MYELPKVSDAQCFSCGLNADVHYAWPWGEQGFACNGCVPQLRSTAARLSREVEIVSLFPGTIEARPTEREEISQLKRELIAKDERIAELEEHAQRHTYLVETLQRQVQELQGGAAHA
jgi:hypothetical protein